MVLAVLTAVPGTASAAKKNKGPNTGNSSLAYIQIFGVEGETDFLYADANYASAQITAVDGATYNKKTNTLTLSDFDAPDKTIQVNEMGSDFTIKLVGKNNIRGLKVWGFGYGGSCTITGKGTLNVNKDKAKNEFGIILYAEDSASVLTIAKTCTVNAWADKAGNAVKVMGSTVKKNIVIKGKSSAKIKTKKESTPTAAEYLIYNFNDEKEDSFEQFEVYKKDGKEYGITQYSNGTADVYRWYKVKGKWAYLFVERTEDISGYKATGETRKGASLTRANTAILKSGSAPVWNYYIYDSKNETAVTKYAVGEVMEKVSGLGKVYKIKKIYDNPDSLKLKTHATYTNNVKGKTFTSKKR